MVKYKDPDLDRTFAALADPTRRALLARMVEQDSISVSDLARPFAISLPAVMKHLDVLSDAGLIERTKTGRTVFCRLNAGPMEQAMQWLNRYEEFWTHRLDRLTALMENETEEESCPTKPAPSRNQASPSNDGSTFRRRSSTRPGRSRRK